MKTCAMIVVALVGAVGMVYANDPAVGLGKKVRMDYTLFVGNEQVETSVGNEPLEFVFGDETIIPGLEAQLNGLHVGEEKVILVEPKDAYGDEDPKAIKEFPLSSLPQGTTPKEGMVLEATAPDGEKFPAAIKEIKGDKALLNFNHPLAGKQLKFNVKILNIENASAAEAQPAVVVPKE